MNSEKERLILQKKRVEEDTDAKLQAKEGQISAMQIEVDDITREKKKN